VLGDLLIAPRRNAMPRHRYRCHAPLTFTHSGHDFSIAAVPSVGDIELQISDRHGRILLPLTIRILAADLRRGPHLEGGPVAREAASRIDWSKPAAAFSHEGHSFAIGTIVTDLRMVFVLRDDRDPFDAPMSIPKDSVLHALIGGRDPVAIGVGAMMAQIRSWSASHTATFIKKTPRLALQLRRIN
jgi:hypothetical protein